MHSAESKLIRAQTHLKAIAKAEERLRKSTKRRIVIQKTRDPHFLKFVLRLPSPPRGFSPLVGDCVHNLRSALDHLVSAIADANAAKVGETRTDKEIHASMFPITLCEHDFSAFERQCRGERLNYVPGKAIKLIKELQPRRRDDPLWILNELENIDKHRKLHLITVGAANLEIDTGASLWTIANPIIRYRDGDAVGGERFEDISKVKVNAEIPVLVAFQDGPAIDRPVSFLLQHVVNLIRDGIFPALDPFLH